ncbi:MAG: alpha/beta fold hydrolase [Succinivibrio sp.]
MRLCIYLCCILMLSACSCKSNTDLIVLKDQGTFSAGGTVLGSSEGFDPFNPDPKHMTLHGDHASVFYQIPVNENRYPLVFLHGAGQSMRTWQSTPDGKDGIANILLKKGYSVYLVDQPRRGEAGRSTESFMVEAKKDDQFWYGQFRLGHYPKRYDNLAFAEGKECLEQFFRQMTPNTGAYDPFVIRDALSAVFDRLDNGGILLSHSQGGGPGFLTAMKNKKVKAVVSFEPGSGFPFPEGEEPEPVANRSFFGSLKAFTVSKDDFLKLCDIPIVIYYGDNIPDTQSDDPYMDYWRAAKTMAEYFVSKVNFYGGNARVVHLPKIGIKGNTHFMFSDTNRELVIDNLDEFFKKNDLK